MSCVRPGVLLTKASRRRPASALMALDLPAFERPAKASSGMPGRGSSCGSCAESTYAACASASGAARARLVAAPSRATVKSRVFGLVSRPPIPEDFLMRAFTGFAGLMVSVYASLAVAGPPSKPDLERGKQIAASVCVACHGADGNSVVPANPVLAGQHAEYIAAQLAAFKSGARPSPVMQAMAA